MNHMNHMSLSESHIGPDFKAYPFRMTTKDFPAPMQGLAPGRREWLCGTFFLFRLCRSHSNLYFVRATAI